MENHFRKVHDLEGEELDEAMKKINPNYKPPEKKQVWGSRWWSESKVFGSIISTVTGKISDFGLLLHNLNIQSQIQICEYMFNNLSRIFVTHI